MFGGGLSSTREVIFRIFRRTGYCPKKNIENFLLSARKIRRAGPLGEEELNTHYSPRHLLLKCPRDRGSCVASGAWEPISRRQGDINRSI